MHNFIKFCISVLGPLRGAIAISPINCKYELTQVNAVPTLHFNVNYSFFIINTRLRLMLSLALSFIMLVAAEQEELYRVALKDRTNQKSLIELTNLLQLTHAQLLELTHYEQVHLHHDGFLQTEQVLLEKKHLKHQAKHQHKNHKKHHPHYIQHSFEPLLDILPLNEEEERIFSNEQSPDALQPIDSEMEHQMEHETTKLITSAPDASTNPFKAHVPLTNVANTMFIGELQVGSASGRNSFDVIFDTGSALTCVASELCKDIGCMKSKRYDRKASNSFHEIGKSVEIVFGSGTLKGLINREQLKVDGLELKDALFIEVTQQIGDAFHEGEFDGIVGLGFPHMTGVPTLFDYMIQQHKLHRNVFAFHLNRELGNKGSELIFGGSDENLIQGEWQYHTVHEKFYWSIMAEEIRVGNENTRICSHEKKCKMVVDTGTTLLTGPKEDVKRLLQMIRVEPKCANYRSMPDITFVIDKKEYVLTHEDYILTITNSGVEPPYQHSSADQIIGCAGTIFPLDLPPKQGPLWILGDIFITKYSALFDRDHNRVGLALSAKYKK